MAIFNLTLIKFDQTLKLDCSSFLSLFICFYFFFFIHHPMSDRTVIFEKYSLWYSIESISTFKTLILGQLYSHKISIVKLEPVWLTTIDL